MARIINSTESMDSLIDEIEEKKARCLSFFDGVIGYIETVKQTGYLEMENYEQLMSQYLGHPFQNDFDKAFGQDSIKMINYLTALKQKMQEYLNVSS